MNPKLTKKSGVTMRFLRFTRYAYRRWGLLTRREYLFLWQFVQIFGSARSGERGYANPRS